MHLILEVVLPAGTLSGALKTQFVKYRELENNKAGNLWRRH